MIQKEITMIKEVILWIGKRFVYLQVEHWQEAQE